MIRRVSFLGCFVLVGANAQAQTSTLAPPQVDAVFATAKLYSAVRYFHPGDVNARVPWDRFLVAATEAALGVGDSGGIGPALEQSFSLFGAVEVTRDEFAKGAPYSPGKHWIEWRHMGVGVGQRTAQATYRSWRMGRDDPPGEVESAEVSRPSPDRWSAFPLAAGWRARVAVSLSSTDALVTRAQDEAVMRMRDDLPAWDVKAPVVTRAQALAAGISVWAVGRHFYPYWQDLSLDWDAAFREWIGAQPERQPRADLLAALRRLTAKLDDGHATVNDLHAPANRRTLPIALRPLGAGFVVTASGIADVAVGDFIEAVDSRPVGEVMRAAIERSSAGAHALPWIARSALLRPEGDAQSARLTLRRGALVREVDIPYLSGESVREKRPAAIAELAAGVHYVDVTRFNRVAFERAMPQLSQANAIVFDLRGYPTGEAFGLPAYWVASNDEAKWMRVPILARPFEPAVANRDLGWGVKPKPGLEKVRKILLIDPRAISYSESLTGYFAAHAKGVIMGEPTAGANGNVSTVDVPGGFAFPFTGMRVTTHQGKVFHTRGFQPDLVAVPTPEGIAAGRDEVLEGAVQFATQPR